MPAPFTQSNYQEDQSPRFVASATVVASPAAAAETIIGSVAIPSLLDLPIASGVLIFGWAAYTVGTSGTTVQFRIRQTSVGGTLVTGADSGAVTASAGNLREQSCVGYDLAPVAGGIYKLTMQVANGAAASTVSAMTLIAIAV
jgi:hypothetical protein